MKGLQKTVLLAAVLFGCSAVAPAKESAFRDNKHVAHEFRKQTGTTNPLNLAAVDYCYAGTVLDPATGEMIDLYVVCPGDGVKQNLDLG